MTSPDTVIDDLSAPHPRAANGAVWELVSDRVMGGVSRGVMTREVVRDRPALRMQGEVSLENNGGFIQIALDLDPRGGTVDARAWAGIEMDVTGNDEDYNLHLRTRDVTRPWQSYRASFRATPDWHRIRLPFTDFTAHRIETALDLSQLRRIGIVAIGRAFDADIAIAGIRFF
ncbi:MAG: CIA30 family protein [Rhodobacteraceae bacterium]|nr:CIA30 family protein [Paracoccaceae bacterium]